MPGIFRAGPENRHLVGKSRIKFHNPEIFRNETIFLNFKGIYMIFC